MDGSTIFGVSSDLISAIANCVMAGGALLIVWQIRQSKLQAITTFEDTLDNEYRRIVHGVPAKILLGEEVPQSELTGYLDELIAYFDLCNQETFLRQRKRISGSTWIYWSDGIRSNLTRPAFKQAWEMIKASNRTDFEELRKLELSGFSEDPASW